MPLLMKPLPKLLSCDLSVTLTLNPAYHRFSVLKQSQYVTNAIKALIGKNWKCTFILEETKNCDIHAHGIVSIPLTPYILKYGARKFLLQKIREHDVFGRIVDVSQVEDFDRWTKYITKDLNVECEYKRVVIDDYKLIPNEHVESNMDIEQLEDLIDDFKNEVM